MLFDYETLKIIWWLLVGALLIGFSIMDGHDMGVCSLLPFVGKDDEERRVIINTIGPHWEGNQVWFITGGGAIFAAWPLIYSAAFSGFYIAMLAVLWTLFLRPVAFEYRSKIPSTTWRNVWDIILFIASGVAPLIFGVAFGNLLQGVPFYLDTDLRVFYTGSFFALLNPFALMCGLLSLSMIIFHGANYLIIRTEGALQKRAVTTSIICGIVVIILFACDGYFVSQMNGFIATNLDPNGPSNPLLKHVDIVKGAWLLNYKLYPITILFPVLGFLGAILGIFFANKIRGGLAFICSSISMTGIIFTVGSAMFPFLMPSISSPTSSLTLWDCTSSHHTLNIMLVVALIFTPIVLLYTSWAYRVMRGKITTKHIRDNSSNLY